MTWEAPWDRLAPFWRESSGLKNLVRREADVRMAQHALFCFLLGCFLPGLVISSGLSAAAGPQAATGPIQDTVEKAVQNYMDAWNTHDVHAVAMTYTEDCDFVNNFGTLTHGRAQMEATFGPFMSGAYSETVQTGHIRTIRYLKPDVAAVDVDWEMTGAKNPDGSKRPTRKGIHSLILTKQSDGSWLI
ncbi:MAG: SgcJ/EcaC family oxidoreductase, partial [Candidatus Acidiferrales bacterium]